MPLSPANHAKYRSARAALTEVRDGMKLGLGTGSTAEWFVKVLAAWCEVHGAKVIGVPTSERTGELAVSLGLEITMLDALGTLDLTVDGADEFDPDLVLIKGGGGAHLREKVVASASDRMVVISDTSKEVPQLGAFPLPVEVIPFGHATTAGHLRKTLDRLGYHDAEIALRGGETAPYLTDERNHIYDLKLGKITDAAELAAGLNAVPGVVEHGLFLGIAKAVYLGHADGRAECLSEGGARQAVAFDDGLDETAFLARWAD
ncbi:MAG: ribose-5-phosphate isomerase RpiA [Pseudomonadota bacterium]